MTETGFTPQYIKALFRRLVKEAGGIQAVGEHLEISFQRVEQLYSPRCADLPQLTQILSVSEWIGSDTFFRAIADAISAKHAPVDVETESFEATEAAAALQKLARKRADPRVIEDAAERLVDEANDVLAAARRAKLKAV